MHRTLFQPVAGGRLLTATRRPLLTAANFLPSDLSGLQVWLETGDYHAIKCFEDTGLTDACEDAEECLGFQDQSGLARHLTHASLGPTFQKANTVDAATPRGKNYLVFNGTDSQLAATSATPWRFTKDGTGMTVFCVANIVGGSNKPLVETGGYDAGGSGMGLWVDDTGGTGGRASLIIRKTSGGAGTVVFAQTPAGADVVPGGEWHLIAADYIAGGPGRVWVDGCFAVSGAQTNNPDAGTDPSIPLTLCKSHSGTPSFGAHSLGALIAYNRVLSLVEHRQVAMYLSGRYGFAAGNVACLGDSITAGSAIIGDYPARLAKLLGGLYRSTNYGVSGGVPSTMYTNQWVHATLGAKRRRTNWVVVLCGINDIRNFETPAATVFADLDDTLDEVVAETGVRLVLCTLLPAGNSDSWNGTKQAILEEYNDLIRAYAAVHASNTYLVDLYALMGAPSDPTIIHPAYDFDGLHPNANGMDVIAAAVAEPILRVGLAA